jgi:hypothetical protein
MVPEIDGGNKNDAFKHDKKEAVAQQWCGKKKDGTNDSFTAGKNNAGKKKSTKKMKMSEKDKKKKKKRFPKVTCLGGWS